MPVYKVSFSGDLHVTVASGCPSDAEALAQRALGIPERAVYILRVV